MEETKNIFVALGLSVLGRGMGCKVSEYSGAAVKNTILSLWSDCNKSKKHNFETFYNCYILGLSLYLIFNLQNLYTIL